MSDEVSVSRENGIMTVTINRPAAKNAINRAVAVAIAAAMDELDASDALRCAVITGAGGTFCSGMDLKGFVSGEFPVVEGRGFAGFCMAPPRKPTIAAVEGYALAGGLELAIACDLVVAGDTARFGIPETKRGLVAGAGGLLRLPRQIPSRIAKELALTGDFIDAARAVAIGLINTVVPAGGALDAALALAAKIAANGPLAVMASKRIIDESRDWSSAEMWQKQDAINAPVVTSEDAIEGARAFAEKRAPIWKSR